ncbi:MAG TPA: EAL domain-containing protein [Gammaproteobacteria bacterium]|nr:EAL domain-containing protein [Gammaproteobacteria bacterium]
MPGTSIKNVLIIDDSADYRQLLLTFFRKACPSVHVEEYDPSGGRPPDTFPWSRYDMLILDYDLGNGENGLEWLRQYKTSGDFPPTIMLTAKDNEELVVNAIRYGAHGFLRKVGLTRNILLEAINDALEKHREEKEQAPSQKIQLHVYNKEKFFDSLKGVKKHDAIILVEIHDYHALSEKLGIFAVDKFVNFFTQIVSDSIKTSGIMAQMTRISDSTLALLLHPGNSPAVGNLLETICKDFDNVEYNADGDSISFSVNIGAVIVDTDKPELSSLLSIVEGACHKARLTQGNSYILEGNDGVITGNEKELIEEVSNAFSENRITPLYQSLVLVSGTGHKDYDELYQIRINIYDSEKNILEPKKFIPLLKKTKSMKKLDRWIIRHCINELSNIRKNNDSLKLGILFPVSEQSVHDKDLTEWIDKIIQHFNIPDLGKGLIFEIDAHNFLGMSAAAKLQFNKLRIRFKAKIALAGANQPDLLDKCLGQEKFNFVMFSPEHTDKEKMQFDQIQSIVKIAQEHKAITVASKIDTGEYLALSASAGADYVLGHFVQPPMENIIATEEVEVGN